MKKNDALKTREFYQSLGTADDGTIGRMFGLTKQTVAYERKKMGIPNVRKKRDDKKWRNLGEMQRVKLLRKYEELGTYQKVADLFGISRQRAHQIINGKRRKDDEEKRD